MASRYLRATGNWNGPVWASTSGGSAGSAATPTASDNVFIAANYSVTLTADATCKKLVHTNGTLSLSSYKLTVVLEFTSYNTTSRTLNFDSGTLEITNPDNPNPDVTTGDALHLGGSGLTFNPGTSLVIINVPQGSQDFSTGSKEFNDVIINMGTLSNETNLDITGSPTFRSLIIQSKNSAAHTVNFDFAAWIKFDKLVAIGSSSASKLTLKGGDTLTDFWTDPGATVYGQFVHVQDIHTDDVASDVPLYIGSNSTTSGHGDWLTQDPPKISTLVDPLTTAPGSNPNWMVSGTVTQMTSGYGGGGYKLGDGPIIGR